MAHGWKNWNFFPHSCLIVFVACLVQVVLSRTLGRDTLKTITANVTYELGYRTRKLPQRMTYLYSVSSGVGLVRLANHELKIYNAAVEVSHRWRASGETPFEKLIHQYIQDYKETSGFLMNETIVNGNENKASKVAEDLIGAYRMVRRFRNYIQRGLCETLASLTSRYSNQSKAMKNLKPLDGEGPLRRDVHLTMFAITFTQLQYGWTPHSVSMGTIKGMELGTTLRAVHCIELGVHAVASGIYSVGIDWLELAALKIQNGDQSAAFKLTLDLLQGAKAKHDKLWHPLTFWTLNATFFAKRLNETSDNDSRQWQRSFAIDSSDDRQLEIVEDHSWEYCTEQLEQTEKTKSELFCWHESTVHPSWKLGPLKVELLAKSPHQVVQFHNVLGSGINGQIRTSCDTVLQTGHLGATQKYFDPKIRMCEVCFEPGQQLNSLTQRVTGLVRTEGKPTPIAIYPPGGHIRLHIDQAGGTDYSELKIATMLYFLEASKIGGELVFPNAQVVAKQLQGSAVLWYNSLKSSEMDYATTHASCALVKGQKRIATQWIPYGPQVHLTCDQVSDTRMNYLFNGKSIQ